jgi:hypothetical protein
MVGRPKLSGNGNIIIVIGTEGRGYIFMYI